MMVHTQASSFRALESGSAGSGGKPLSVVNLPFADFALPLSSITQERQELPYFAQFPIPLQPHVRRLPSRH